MIGSDVCISQARAINCARDAQKVSRRDRRRDWRSRNRAAPRHGTARFSGSRLAAAGLAAFRWEKAWSFADRICQSRRSSKIPSRASTSPFSAPAPGRRKQFAPIAQRAGAVVIDNSSAFRMDADVPLVIPEINPEDIRRHRGMIANPNCTTAVALMALYPLHSAFGLRRVFASSYQAVSGSGARAIEELQAAGRGNRGRWPGEWRAFIPTRLPSTSSPTSIPFSILATRGKK